MFAVSFSQRNACLLHETSLHKVRQWTAPSAAICPWSMSHTVVAVGLSKMQCGPVNSNFWCFLAQLGSQTNAPSTSCCGLAGWNCIVRLFGSVWGASNGCQKSSCTFLGLLCTEVAGQGISNSDWFPVSRSSSGHVSVAGWLFVTLSGLVRLWPASIHSIISAGVTSGNIPVCVSLSFGLW